MFKAYLLRFFSRTVVFIFAAVVYIISPEALRLSPGFVPLQNHWYLYAVWAMLMVDILVRFFPRRFTSAGSLKQFRRFYVPAPEPLDFKQAEDMKLKMDRGALKVAAVWLAGNAVVFYLYFSKIIGTAEMLLLTLFYFMCDMICIVFFCPFRKYIMKNRCCISCRIFNWDALMMCTPMLPIASVFSWSLFAAAAALFLVWELRWRRHPEYFLPLTNKKLRCENCTERLCKFKRLMQKETFIVK